MHLALGSFMLIVGITFSSAIAANPKIKGDRVDAAPSAINMSCNEAEALSGSKKAAMVCSAHYPQDPPRTLYWLQIAAENGDAIGQYNFAMQLFSKKEPMSRVRAIFWLNESARQGNSYAKEVLARLARFPDASIPPEPPH